MPPAPPPSPVPAPAVAPAPAASPAAAAPAARVAPLGRRLVQVEAALTLMEALLIGVPLFELATPALRATGLGFRVAPIVGALVLLAWVRAVDSLRPVFAARAAKMGGQVIPPALLESAQRAMTRAPAEAALLRWAIWIG